MHKGMNPLFIKEIQLKNYRNYEHLELSFENKVNVIIGENAQGKTNLMEAIYVLAMAKSHRTSNDKELIRWDEDYGKIKGRVQKRNSSLSLELTISKKGKKAKLNHLEQQKLSQYIGNMNVVMFAPEDLNLVKGSPKYEDAFWIWKLDKFLLFICMILSQYQKVSQQRNHLFKKMQQNKKTRI